MASNAGNVDFSTDRASMKIRYEIEKITDILDIPEAKFEKFLIDLRQYYEINRGIIDITQSYESTQADVKFVPHRMIWVDDGKHDVTMKLITRQPEASDTQTENA